jgi:hypothetical protein
MQRWDIGGWTVAGRTFVHKCLSGFRPIVAGPQNDSMCERPVYAPPNRPLPATT